MSSRACRMVVLCEDRQHETFIYRLLKDLGVPRRRIKTITSPRGDGAADQFVQEQYADELELHRRTAARMSVGLVIMIDADENTVQDRLHALNASLSDRNLRPRAPGESVCLLIPKRNIETWIRALFGDAVNERDAYPKLERPGDCQPAVDQLVGDVRHGCREDVIPSLRRGCRELRTRLPQ